jgi:hypothetical protein
MRSRLSEDGLKRRRGGLSASHHLSCLTTTIGEVSFACLRLHRSAKAAASPPTAAHRQVPKGKLDPPGPPAMTVTPNFKPGPRPGIAPACQ